MWFLKLAIQTKGIPLKSAHAGNIKLIYIIRLLKDDLVTNQPLTTIFKKCYI